jgi:hypothetical protein
MTPTAKLKRVRELDRDLAFSEVDTIEVRQQGER